MKITDHLKAARTELSLGHLFEAAEHLSKASEVSETYGSEFQPGIDAVASMHSKLERMIVSLENVAERMDAQIIPRWTKVVASELKEPPSVKRTAAASAVVAKRVEAPLGGSEENEDSFPEEEDNE